MIEFALSKKCCVNLTDARNQTLIPKDRFILGIMFSSIYLQELAILVKNARPVEASTPEVVRKGSVCVAYVSFVSCERATF